VLCVLCERMRTQDPRCVSWDTVLAEAQLTPGRTEWGDVQEEVATRLHGSGPLQGKILSSDVYVPDACGGQQPLIDATYAEDVVPISTPLQGQACGHAILVSTVAVFGTPEATNAGTSRRLLQNDDRDVKESELRRLETTWEKHSRLRRYQTTADVLRHHTTDSYKNAPSASWYQPFGQVRSATSRFSLLLTPFVCSQDIRWIPDPADEPSLRCPIVDGHMRCRQESLPLLPDETRTVNESTSGPITSVGTVLSTAIDRASRAARDARVASAESRNHMEHALQRRAYESAVASSYDTPPAPSSSRKLLIFGSIGGERRASLSSPSLPD